MNKDDTVPAVRYVVMRCPDTGLLVGYIPGVLGAHSQGATDAELLENLREALALLDEEDA